MASKCWPFAGYPRGIHKELQINCWGVRILSIFTVLVLCLTNYPCLTWKTFWTFPNSGFQNRLHATTGIKQYTVNGNTRAISTIKSCPAQIPETQKEDEGGQWFVLLIFKWMLWVAHVHDWQQQLPMISAADHPGLYNQMNSKGSNIFTMLVFSMLLQSEVCWLHWFPLEAAFNGIPSDLDVRTILALVESVKATKWRPHSNAIRSLILFRVMARQQQGLVFDVEHRYVHDGVSTVRHLHPTGEGWKTLKRNLIAISWIPWQLHFRAIRILEHQLVDYIPPTASEHGNGPMPGTYSCVGFGLAVFRRLSETPRPHKPGRDRSEPQLLRQRPRLHFGLFTAGDEAVKHREGLQHGNKLQSMHGGIVTRSNSLIEYFRAAGHPGTCSISLSAFESMALALKPVVQINMGRTLFCYCATVPVITGVYLVQAPLPPGLHNMSSRSLETFL